MSWGPADPTAFDYEAVTVDGTAGGVGFTAGTYAPSTEEAAVRAVLSLETAPIRFTYDGTAPTTSVGHPMQPGDVVELSGAANIAAFRAIRTTATSGTLRVSFGR